MAAPGISITLANGALDAVITTEDGVAGIVMTGVAATGLALGVSKQLFTLAEAEAIGITSAYDVTNTTNVWKTIKDFYAEAGSGKELWIMIVAKTSTMSTICDTANSILKKLLNDADGRIRIVGVTRVPDGAYVATYTGQLDADVIAAAAKAHALHNEFRAEFKPFRTVLDGRDFQGTIGSLSDLKASAFNSVAVCIGTDVSGSKNASIGLVIGRLAANPVQRNIGRVKDGDLGIQAAFLTNQSTDTKTFTIVSGGQIDQIHNKGYIFMRKYPNRNGYYFNDDPTAAPATDDYDSIALGRVIDKAIIVTQKTYVDEILDDLEVGEDGFLLAAIAKSYQAKIDKALLSAFNQPGKDKEVSSVSSEISAQVNIVVTGIIPIKVRVTPKGYGKQLVIDLGFEL